ALPFVSRFYSKEIIIEIIIIKPLNKTLTVSFITLIIVTTAYSLKIIIIVNLSKISLTIKIKKELYNQKIRKMILLIPSIVLGNKLA
ncbi:hypothetical protein, partial [Bacillus anthracis]|uniref:hypothetical protein n=2 Tax=Bacteria TaxID=2 RepID=UPI001E516A01